nr:DUF2806 domain-containing protein [uncultured Cellulosilyticum sp.]
MTQINLPLSDLGKLGQPIADIANNLINKFSSAIGWCATPKGLKHTQLEAYNSIISEIAKRDDINPIERGAIISNWKKAIKEYTNQYDILEVAIEHLTPTAHPENLDEEWLQFFVEKSKLASKDETKLLWGKILAEECNNPNSVSKSLLNTLSLIDSNLALAFTKVVSHSIIAEDDEALPIISFNDNQSYYDNINLSFSVLTELDNYNLIKFNALTGYALQRESLSATYFNTKLEAKSQTSSIPIGNVILTNDGAQLFKIIDKEKYDKFLEMVLQHFTKNNMAITTE